MYTTLNRDKFWHLQKFTWSNRMWILRKKKSLVLFDKIKKKKISLFFVYYNLHALKYLRKTIKISSFALP